MSAQIISGTEIAKDIRQQITTEVSDLKARTGITPGLAVIIVGENPASQVYVRQKEKGCEETGMYFERHALQADVTQKELLSVIGRLNEDVKIHGFLVQLPLPDHINENEVLFAVDSAKDVDGFHPVSIGKMVIGEETFLPATAHGIMVLLEKAGVDLTGKEAVVVGRSNIVGKPVSTLLLQKHATVTICHTRTKDLAFHTQRADVLVVAAGKPEIIKGDMVKDGVIVIDVGVNRVGDKLVGDVEFASVSEKAAAITPVPGGVGPMTVTMLLQNTLQAARQFAKGLEK